MQAREFYFLWILSSVWVEKNDHTPAYNFCRSLLVSVVAMLAVFRICPVFPLWSNPQKLSDDLVLDSALQKIVNLHDLYSSLWLIMLALLF